MEKQLEDSLYLPPCYCALEINKISFKVLIHIILDLPLWHHVITHGTSSSQCLSETVKRIYVLIFGPWFKKQEEETEELAHSDAHVTAPGLGIHCVLSPGGHRHVMMKFRQCSISLPPFSTANTQICGPNVITQHIHFPEGISFVRRALREEKPWQKT